MESHNRVLISKYLWFDWQYICPITLKTLSFNISKVNSKLGTNKYGNAVGHLPLPGELIEQSSLPFQKYFLKYLKVQIF